MRNSTWLYQYSSSSKYAYGPACPTPSAAPPPPQHHQVLAYGSTSESSSLGEYNNNGRPYEFELGTYDDNHWAKDRPHVKQEPAEVRTIEKFFKGPSV